jgi:tight adherence protein C
VSVLAGSLLGAAAGGGLLLVATGSPLARKPTLEDRLGPYLRDTPRPSRLLTRAEALTPFPTLERILRPVLGDAMRFVERWVGGIASVRRRLEQLGGQMTVEQFRAGKRLLLESAGKREIGMMVPVVFFVLPVTIVFALFPGFYGLSLTSP